jgi:hypothetical protein
LLGGAQHLVRCSPGRLRPGWHMRERAIACPKACGDKPVSLQRETLGQRETRASHLHKFDCCDLSAETGDQRLDNRRNQKDKNKVRRRSAGKIIFSGLSHGSSQGLTRGAFIPQIHGAGLYTAASREQAASMVRMMHERMHWRSPLSQNRMPVPREASPGTQSNP